MLKNLDFLEKDDYIFFSDPDEIPNPNLLKEKPKHNMASHMSDALRYALYSFETSATTF